MKTTLIKLLTGFTVMLILSFGYFTTTSLAINDISERNLNETIYTTPGFSKALSNGELERLIKDAPNNSTITLTKDYAEVQSISIEGKNITLDLNNHNILFADSKLILLKGGSLNIKGDGTILGTTSQNYCLFDVVGSPTDIPNYTKLVIDKGVKIAYGSESTGILIMGEKADKPAYGTTVDLYGELQVVSEKNSGSSMSGLLIGGENSPNSSNPPKVILRESSDILVGHGNGEDDSTGIKASKYCNIISEGTIEGSTACFLMGNGNLTISKGKYDAKKAPIYYYNDNNKYHSSVTITGGTFINRAGGDCIYNQTDFKDAKIAISGGIFSYYPDVYLVKGKKSEWNNSDRMLHVVDDVTPSPSNSCPSAKFTDVNKNESHWTHKPIDYVLQKGYMTGVSATSFNPNGNVTRGTIAQILYAAEGKPTVSGKSKFTDVKDGKWYSNAINWAATNGIVSGYGNGKFGPDNPITREQMVAIMYKYSAMKGYDLTANANINSFADKNKISKYAVTAVTWAVGHKIISGTKNGIEPKGNATRAQIAVILQAYDNNVRK